METYHTIAGKKGQERKKAKAGSLSPPWLMIPYYLLAVFLLIALVLLLIVLAVVLLLVLAAVILVVLIVLTILHEDTSFRPTGYGPIVDRRRWNYTKKFKKIR